MLCNIDASPIYLWVYKEHLDRNIISDSSVGLSLCIQGTPNKNRLFGGWPRFIPVHTGNTILTNLALLDLTVYPCAYREHPLTTLGVESETGLSLCIQGTPQL